MCCLQFEQLVCPEQSPQVVSKATHNIQSFFKICKLNVDWIFWFWGEIKGLDLSSCIACTAHKLLLFSISITTN
ncbi:unnamed protein product [Blepharisma stoltei]|uniref:Uncharacterized protein n=1 Tax=Blepharisma stoltei TaxID=1481888 RepID=A0AAU9J459_9CILI|nr:unnamed protein product [Blepharisma stoltei]